MDIKTGAIMASPSEVIVGCLADILEQVCLENDNMHPCVHPLVKSFFLVGRATMPLYDYIHHLFYDVQDARHECFVVAAIYLDRLRSCSAGFMLQRGNSFKTLLTCLLVASKVLEDGGARNSFYAREGGVPLAKLNLLEANLLQMLDWDVHVTANEYTSYVKLFAPPELICMRHNAVSPKHWDPQCNEDIPDVEYQTKGGQVSCKLPQLAVTSPKRVRRRVHCTSSVSHTSLPQLLATSACSPVSSKQLATPSCATTQPSTSPLPVRRLLLPAYSTDSLPPLDRAKYKSPRSVGTYSPRPPPNALCHAQFYAIAPS